MEKRLARIALIGVIALQLQGCAITAATVLAASATGVSVAEDVFGIATKYRELKKEWMEDNNTKAKL